MALDCYKMIQLSEKMELSLKAFLSSVLLLSCYSTEGQEQRLNNLFCFVEITEV